MDKIYGVGIRGTGQVAVEHVAALKANPYTRVVAVCGRREESAQEFVRQYAPEAKVYTDYEAMLADPEVEIVSECMPNYLHAAEGTAALLAGKHLILEKPAGITQEETDRLFAAAQQARRKRWSLCPPLAPVDP